MAQIHMTKVAGAAVLGAVDIYAQSHDASAPATSLFRRWSTWARVIGLVGGALGVTQNFQPELAEGMMLASIPMMEEVVYKMVQPSVGGLPAIQNRVNASTGYRPVGHMAPVGRSIGEAPQDRKIPGLR